MNLQLGLIWGTFVIHQNNTLRLPGVEPGSIAWKAIILTVGLQTLTRFTKNIDRCIISL